MAASLKAKGNTVYQHRKFAQAAELYTQAIEVSPKPEPVFYSNRAACKCSAIHIKLAIYLEVAGYVNMSPPKHDLVVADCDAALELDSNYVKALNRRAGALEQLKRYPESLRDFTAATILDKFQNETAAQAVERVLKKLAGDKATEILAVSTAIFPFVTL